MVALSNLATFALHVCRRSAVLNVVETRRMTLDTRLRRGSGLRVTDAPLMQHLGMLSRWQARSWLLVVVSDGPFGSSDWRRVPFTIFGICLRTGITCAGAIWYSRDAFFAQAWARLHA